MYGRPLTNDIQIEPTPNLKRIKGPCENLYCHRRETLPQQCWAPISHSNNTIVLETIVALEGHSGVVRDIGSNGGGQNMCARTGLCCLLLSPVIAHNLQWSPVFFVHTRLNNNNK